MKRDIIEFNDNMVRKYRWYLKSVNKDGNNLGHLDYILDNHLDEYINDTQHIVNLMQKLKNKRKTPYNRCNYANNFDFMD